MGDIKKQRKKFAKPSHPWQKSRLDEEAVVLNEFALKNKKEIWKMQSKLKHFTSMVKDLATVSNEKAARESGLLLASLRALGILKEEATMDEVLNLRLRDIMERRLQTIVFRKGLAKTMKQARQFIVHKHIAIDQGVVSVPSYLVKKSEEELISFYSTSSLSNADHPERFVEKKKETPKETAKEKPKEEKQKSKAKQTKPRVRKEKAEKK
jgi:small subunit ribosomal protein S4